MKICLKCNETIHLINELLMRLRINLDKAKMEQAQQKSKFI